MLLLNRSLIKMAKGLWGWILIITGLKLLALAEMTTFARIIAGYLGRFGAPDMTAERTTAAVGTAFVTAVLLLVTELLTGEAEYRCNAKARQSLRTRIFRKVMSLDVGYIEKIGPVSAITASVDGVESMLVYYSQYMPGLIYSLLSPVYLFFQLRSISLPVAVMLLTVSLILLPANNIFRQYIESLKTEYWNALEDLTRYYLESVRGLTTFKLYNQDQSRTETLRKKSRGFADTVMRMMRINFISFLITDGLIYLSVAAAMAIACRQMLAGEVSFDQGLVILMLSFSFFSAVRKLMNSTHSALTGVAAADKVDRILEIDTTRPYHPELERESEAFDGILLEHVCFSYQKGKEAIRDVSLAIPRMRMTAIAGMSGCGKSTIAGLLMRFSDLDSGRILIEGRDSTAWKPEELRRHIIMVPQAVSLFSGTIAENLRIASPEASDQELMQVLSEVQLGDWVRALPEGLYAQVGDAGSRLSGGQRQKIGIARALLSRAEYIIFDEATSSVDLESEREIWTCIQGLAKIRTLIIISHRLSTIAMADVIYVLSEGSLVEEGDHNALMAKQGLYCRLVNEQTELERQGEVHGNVR